MAETDSLIIANLQKELAHNKRELSKTKLTLAKLEASNKLEATKAQDALAKLEVISTEDLSDSFCLGTSEEPAKRIRREESFVASKAPEDDMNESLQHFAYEYDCGSKRARLSFRTFKSRMHEGELEEIFSVFGCSRVMVQAEGLDVTAKTLKEANNVRNAFLARNSLTRDARSIMWKVYYTADSTINQKPKLFVGYMGMYLTNNKQLRVLVYLNSQSQGKGVGSKGMLCLLLQVLRYKAWFFACAETVVVTINPSNVASLALKDKMFANHAVEHRNPDSKNGIWPFSNAFYTDNVTRTIYVREFQCNIQSLEKIWESQMNQQVNRVDYLLLSNDYSSGCSTVLHLADSAEANFLEGDPVFDAFVTDTSIQELDWKFKLDESMEAKMQEFSYVFKHQDRSEVFTFRTFNEVGTEVEVEQVLSVFRDATAMNYHSPGNILQCQEEARLLREKFREQTSFSSVSKTILWKLYHSWETNPADQADPNEDFIGFVSLKKLDMQLFPQIFLLSKYGRRGFGAKISISLLLRLLWNKQWFQCNFDSVKMSMNPRNSGALALMKSVFKDYVVEVQGGTQQLVHYECNSIPRLESLWMSHFAKAQNNKACLWWKRPGRAPVGVSLSRLPGRFGLFRVYVDPCETRQLVNKLLPKLLVDSPVVQPAELTLMGYFDIWLPDLAKSSPDTFYLLFCMSANQLQEFHVTHGTHNRVRQRVLSFKNIGQDQGKKIQVRLFEPTLSSVVVYLVELDLEVFQLASSEKGLYEEGLKRFWRTNSFNFMKRKIKIKPRQICVESLVLMDQQSFTSSF